MKPAQQLSTRVDTDGLARKVALGAWSASLHSRMIIRPGCVLLEGTVPYRVYDAACAWSVGHAGTRCGSHAPPRPPPVRTVRACMPHANGCRAEHGTCPPASPVRRSRLIRMNFESCRSPRCADLLLSCLRPAWPNIRSLTIESIIISSGTGECAACRCNGSRQVARPLRWHSVRVEGS
jgi:hypothetical protein